MKKKMRIIAVVVFLTYGSVLSWAQITTSLNFEFDQRVIDQSDIRGKGLFLLTGIERQKAVQNIQLVWVDETGNHRYQVPLLKRFAKQPTDKILLIASESSSSVYVIAYKLDQKKPCRFRIFEIDSTGNVLDYELEMSLTIHRNILFACASSAGLHLFVRQHIPKGEEGNFSRKSDGAYTGQYFIPHQAKTAEFINMDAFFNPATVLSDQKGDTLTLFISDDRSLILYKFHIAKNEMLAQGQIETQGLLMRAINYARPQNGFYQERANFYSMLYSAGGANGGMYTYIGPYGCAYWTICVNGINGQTYAIATRTNHDRIVKGRKKKYGKYYYDEVFIITFDSKLKALDSLTLEFPVELDNSPDDINVLWPKEEGTLAHLFYSVNDKENQLNAILTRGTNTGYALVRFDMNTADTVSFKISNKIAKVKSGLGKNYYECYMSCLLLDQTNGSLSSQVQKYIMENNLPKYGSDHYVQLVSHRSDSSAIILEFQSKKYIRIIRFAPGETVISKDYTLQGNKPYLVEQF